MNQSELKVPTCMASRPCDTSVVNRFLVHIRRKGSLFGIRGLSSGDVSGCADIGVCCSSTSAAWWILAIVAIAGSIVGQFLWEGDGHEILLEGEVKGNDGIVRRVD